MHGWINEISGINGMNESFNDWHTGWLHELFIELLIISLLNECIYERIRDSMDACWMHWKGLYDLEWTKLYMNAGMD